MQDDQEGEQEERELQDQKGEQERQAEAIKVQVEKEAKEVEKAKKVMPACTSRVSSDIIDKRTILKKARFI